MANLMGSWAVWVRDGVVPTRNPVSCRWGVVHGLVFVRRIRANGGLVVYLMGEEVA